jgi:uncharacterized protein (DUF1501 family)
MLIRSRRDFMKAALSSVGMAGALGSLGKFGEVNALAAGSGYKALVCIFMAGGNDSHNTVIPITTGQQNYSLYAQGRGPLALPLAGLPGISNGADTYGLHPNMPEMAALYNAGNAAIVVNAGMLVQPITQAQYLSGNPVILPAQLFSHSDQSNQWQTAIPNSAASTGWGGTMADSVASYNSGATFAPVTSTGGCGLFCTGQQTSPATVPPSGAAVLQGATGSRLPAFQQLLTFTNGLQLVQAANSNLSRGVTYSQALTAALATATINTVFPASELGQQLLTVAKIMKVQQTLGIYRQVFFCQLGGFDTHGGQLPIQQQLLTDLSQSTSQFYSATTQELGMGSNVVTFTASEFGRTLQSNGSGGTDHAWGGHHFVISQGVNSGGSLVGGQFFGTFPSLALGGPNDANTRGTLIPTTSVEQYAATIATWFGLTPANLATVFPYLANFPTSNLGFLG